MARGITRLFGVWRSPPPSASPVGPWRSSRRRSCYWAKEPAELFGGVQANMWGKGFRAYDKATGEVVWETELDAGTTGGPMSYMHDGNQYIVVAIGGRQHPPEFIALGLP